MNRKQKSLVQKLFYIDRPEINTFLIMGTTKNVYHITINDTPSCTCPDYVTRNNRCKHIYFVLMRVLKQENADKIKFSEQDVDKMLNVQLYLDKLIVDDDAKEKYDFIKNQKITAKSSDDLCPICLDDLINGDNIIYCKAKCGKCVHEECFKMWCHKNIPKCVYCSSPWNVTYINLK